MFLIYSLGGLKILKITMGNKDDRFELRIKPDVKEELRVTAEMHGLSPSSLVHSLIVKKINEAKKESPEKFKKLPKGELATKAKKLIKAPKLDSDKKNQKAA